MERPLHIVVFTKHVIGPRSEDFQSVSGRHQRPVLPGWVRATVINLNRVEKRALRLVATPRMEVRP